MQLVVPVPSVLPLLLLQSPSAGRERTKRPLTRKDRHTPFSSSKRRSQRRVNFRLVVRSGTNERSLSDRRYDPRAKFRRVPALTTEDERPTPSLLQSGQTRNKIRPYNSELSGRGVWCALALSASLDGVVGRAGERHRTQAARRPAPIAAAFASKSGRESARESSDLTSGQRTL